MERRNSGVEKSMRQKFSHTATLVCSFLICVCSACPALAQAADEKDVPKSYVMPYFIVGLGITLGLVAVCRPSKRAKNVRRPE